MPRRATATASRRDLKAPRLHETRVELDVPFHHVDALGIVWHGHYPKYFEAAGMALLRKLALDGGDLIGERYRLVVIETGVPARVSAALCRPRRRHRVDLRLRAAPRDPLRTCATSRTIGRAAHGHTTLATLDADGRLRLETPPRSSRGSARDPSRSPSDGGLMQTAPSSQRDRPGDAAALAAHRVLRARIARTTSSICSTAPRSTTTRSRACS
jgi:acyl-CoA thioester hydrolase